MTFLIIEATAQLIPTKNDNRVASTQRKTSLIALQLASTPIRLSFPLGLRFGDVVSVQRPHDADAGEHGRAATLDHEE